MSHSGCAVVWHFEPRVRHISMSHSLPCITCIVSLYFIAVLCHIFYCDISGRFGPFAFINWIELNWLYSCAKVVSVTSLTTTTITKMDITLWSGVTVGSSISSRSSRSVCIDSHRSRRPTRTRESRRSGLTCLSHQSCWSSSAGVSRWTRRTCRCNTHTHARTHARTHAHTDTHARGQRVLK